MLILCTFSQQRTWENPKENSLENSYLQKLLWYVKAVSYKFKIPFNIITTQVSDYD